MIGCLSGLHGLLAFIALPFLPFLPSLTFMTFVVFLAFFAFFALFAFLLIFGILLYHYYIITSGFLHKLMPNSYAAKAEVCVSSVASPAFMALI